MKIFKIVFKKIFKFVNIALFDLFSMAFQFHIVNGQPGIMYSLSL